MVSTRYFLAGAQPKQHRPLFLYRWLCYRLLRTTEEIHGDGTFKNTPNLCYLLLLYSVHIMYKGKVFKIKNQAKFKRI